MFTWIKNLTKRNKKPLYQFPNHPIIPTKPLVFDDSALVKNAYPRMVEKTYAFEDTVPKKKQYDDDDDSSSILNVVAAEVVSDIVTDILDSSSSGFDTSSTPDFSGGGGDFGGGGADSSW